MNVIVYNEQTDLLINPTTAEPVVRYVLEKEQIKADEVVVFFVSEEVICELHRDFFNDPSPTDCITFPLDDMCLGEVFICPKIALDRQASADEEVADTPYQETTLYLIHTILHLIGYEDTEPVKRAVMHERQQLYLNELIQKNLLLSA